MKLGIVLAGVLGSVGVASAAASSHAGAALLGPLSLIALSHAPALLALSLTPLGGGRLHTATIGLLGAGACFFCADLAARHVFGTGLFPLSAPIGGVLMMAGWAMTVVWGASLANKRSDR